MDFLRALDGDLPDADMKRMYRLTHNVWETAVWMQVADRRLVHRADGSHAIIPAGDAQPGDRVLPNDLLPCKVDVPDTGHYIPLLIPRSRRTSCCTTVAIPGRNQRALREALPALYCSFAPEHN